ncbi:MAG: dockerin type I domain-containing protein [Candidatus Zixiibacteriota bacterium]
MKRKTSWCRLLVCFVFAFCLFSATERGVLAQSINLEIGGARPEAHGQSDFLRSSSTMPYDTAEVEVLYTTSYPGRFAEVEVRLKNPDPIAGFQFEIILGGTDFINFHIDSVTVDSTVIRVDTCTGPQPHGDSCYIDSLVRVTVSHCHIDTVGSPVSDFQWVVCHCHAGDTSLLTCRSVMVLGLAKNGHPLPSSGSYQRLFKFGMDLSCLSDTVTDRSVSFYMFPGQSSFLSNPAGELVPFRYHQGELSAWWSVPGDASGDSLVNAGDVVFMINYLFKNGPRPCMMEAGDPTADCVVDAADVVSLVNYLFRQGPALAPGCAH